MGGGGTVYHIPHRSALACVPYSVSFLWGAGCLSWELLPVSWVTTPSSVVHASPVSLEICGPFASSLPFWDGAGDMIPSAPSPVGVGLVGGPAPAVVSELAIMHRDLAGEELVQDPELRGSQGAPGVPVGIAQLGP